MIFKSGDILRVILATVRHLKPFAAITPVSVSLDLFQREMNQVRVFLFAYIVILSFYSFVL